MIDLLQVQVRHPGIALTEKEQKLVECLVLRICAHHLYRRLGRPFKIRRANVDSIHLLVNQVVFVEDGIQLDEIDQLMKDMTTDIRTTLELCDVSSEDIVLTAKA
ncbi:hypothetical protein [Alicyclobacillus acidiphilus]|uniref:hypothetical protein n=1 Tax=Alicyclobacillus acidiphilus TaxID=182455 RepID=UPI00082D9572|nr:hypothetical protein [Alicyclobacillus acidiphilus]